MKYTKSFKGRSYGFQDLKTLLAKASPLRSADRMAGIAADSELERAQGGLHHFLPNRNIFRVFIA